MGKIPQHSFEDARAVWEALKRDPNWKALEPRVNSSVAQLVQLRGKHGTNLAQVLRQWGVDLDFSAKLEEKFPILREHAAELDLVAQGEPGYASEIERLVHGLLGERGRNLKPAVCAQLQEKLGLVDGPDLRGQIAREVDACGRSLTALAKKAGFEPTPKLEQHLAELGNGKGHVRLWAETVWWLSENDSLPKPLPSPAPPKPPVPPPQLPTEDHSDEEGSDHETLFDPPPVVPAEELAYTQFMAVLAEGGTIEVNFERTWLAWRYGVLTSPDYTRKGVGIKRCVQLSRKLHNGAGAAFLEGRGLKDEHVLRLVTIFKDAFEFFGHALDYRAMHRMLRAHPPSWEDIQAKLAGTDPEFKTVQALKDFCQRFDTVGKAMRSAGVVNGNKINYVRYFLLGQGVDCIPEEEIPTKKMTVTLAVPLPPPTPLPVPAPLSQGRQNGGSPRFSPEEKTRLTVSILDVKSVIGSLSHAVRNVLRRDAAACRRIMEQGPTSQDPELRWAAVVLIEAQRMATSESYARQEGEK